MNRNSNLDGIRGLAALAVVLGHSNTLGTGLAPLALQFKNFAGATGSDIAARIWHTVFNADAAVMLFFVLSGYVLTLGLQNCGRKPAQELSGYVIRRLFRIYPVAILAAVPLAFLYPLDWKQTLNTMLLTDRSANAVLWTLQIELIGSAVLFALWTIGHRAVSVAVILGILGTARFWLHFEYPYFFACMPALILGSLLPAVPRKLWESRLLLAASIAVLLCTDLFMNKELHWRYLTTIAACGIVGCLTVQRFAVLDSTPVQFLGRICFPLYVLHMSAVLVAQPLLNELFPSMSLLRTLAFVVATGIPTILAAAITHKVVEAPAIRAGSWLARRTVVSVRGRSNVAPDAAVN